MLREADPAEEILCDECEEGCQIRPRVRKDRRTGRRVGVCYCGRNPDVGRFTVNLGCLRQWTFDLMGLARLVAKSAGASGRPVEVESGRLVMLGTARIDGKSRELFLARGAAWPDAARLFENASRLKMAQHAAVLTLVGTPKEPLLAGCELAIRPLVEIAELQKGKLKVSPDGAFPDMRPGPWADISNEAVTLDQFMVRYCEKRAKNLRRSRRLALLGAARNETIKMPPLACRRKRGQSNKYFVHDLLNAWQGYQDENLDLPPLLQQYRTSLARKLPAVIIR